MRALFLLTTMITKALSYQTKSPRVLAYIKEGVTVAAPMVAASDYAFRCLARQHNTQICFTQMLHAKNVCHDTMFRQNHFDFYEYQNEQPDLLPSQENFLKGTVSSSSLSGKSEYSKGPLIVQLAGHDVDTVVRAAHIILEHTPEIDGFDLNCGCPQGIARKGNYGAFLMEQDEEQVRRILKALRQSLPVEVAVSNKIRLPTSDKVLKERVLRLVDTGIDFLTIHGRTLKENKTNVRECHLDRIRLAIDTIHEQIPDFPVISNGGIEYSSDIPDILKRTGAIGVMSSEALLETPNVFTTDLSKLSQRQVFDQQVGFARDYLEWCRMYPPLPGVLGHVGGSFNVCRGHLFKFLHRYLNDHTDLRDKLASHKTQTYQDAVDLVNELESRYINLTDEEIAGLRSSDSSSSWYRRHRLAGDRVHQKPVQISSDLLAQPSESLSIEERKAMMKKRILKLKAQRKERIFE